MKEYTHYKNNILWPTLCGYMSECRFLGTRVSYSKNMVDCTDCKALLEAKK